MERLIDKLLDLRLFRSFKVRTTPRWIILLLDMLIVLFCFVATVVADIYSMHSVIAPSTIILNAFLVLAVYFFVTYISKSYTCVIRLSVIEDLYRIFMAIVVSTLLLAGINILKLAITGVPFMKFWNILIIGALSFSIMMIERLCIKYLYMRMNSDTKGRKRVLVLGTTFSSVLLANALKGEIGGKFLPVGLLSIKSGPDNSEINGFKVYRFDPLKMNEIFAEQSIDALLFDSKSYNLMSSGFADYFIKNDISLLAMNKIAEFEHNKENHDAGISTFIKEVQIEDLLGREPIVLNNTLVNQHINGSCVLITGACGSIGSEIVRQVANYGASKIVLLDQAETPMHDIALEMKKDYPSANIELFMGDVRNRERVEEAFDKFRPRYVFHAAAYKHVPMMEINPTEAILANVMGTRNVADLALKYDVYKFVMISTDKAVNPTNVMGCTKRLAEIYCQSLFFDAQRRGKKTQFITTRFGNVLGSNGSVIPLFRKQIAAGGPVTVTHKDIIRYFMTIPEACSLVLEAGCMGSGGEIYIFDMGEPVKIYDMARRMISLAGLKPDVDIKIVEIGLRPGEKLYEELLNDKEKTTATVNRKIMIAKVRTYDYQDVCANIDNIITLAARGDVHGMIYAMKEFVPEYKSQHSRFEAIDKEIEQESRPENPDVNQPTAE
ncbi:MAG: nucleoside-diphosphate sugar epimerase/dehydratase [Bacteroidales bacterium]|nr:nucleoside-diphosphate sugar epimerase/dehydratase [Bacteroidales bacterium]